jgi:hypothetical protein
LQPNGTLHLTEPVLVDTATSAKLPEFPEKWVSLKSRLPSRTGRALVSDLKLAGFVDVQVLDISRRVLEDEKELERMVELWGGLSVVEKIEGGLKEVVAGLKGRLEILTVIAKKPAYEIGKASVLSFKRKAPSAATTTVAAAPAPAPSSAATKAVKKAVWTVSANDDDDDQELEDEDALLDEEDLKPVVAVGMFYNIYALFVVMFNVVYVSDNCFLYFLSSLFFISRLWRPHELLWKKEEGLQGLQLRSC